METYIDLIIKGIVYTAVAVFMWKIWPVVREWAVVKQAVAIVHQMEEQFGAKSGELKFETAVELLQRFVSKLGWKIDLSQIYAYITSAVGMLHARQGVIPEKAKVPEV